MGGGVAGDEPAEAVGCDGLEPEWEFANAWQHVRGGLVAPASLALGAAGAGRGELGRAVHGGLLGGGDLMWRSVAPAGTAPATGAV
jgi:hypothetical protein